MQILQPLRNKVFAGIWVSYSVSVAATAILPTILTLMILDWHDGIADLGIALSVRTLGFVVGAVAGGYFADRLPRQKVLCAASALRSASTLAIALFFHDRIDAISGCLFFSGAGEGIFRSAYQATMADVIPAELRQSANALTTLSLRIALTAGPLLAVAMHASFGGSFGLWAASLLWALSAAIVFGLQHRLAGRQPLCERASTSFLADYRDGLAEAFRHRWFVTGLAVLLVWLGLGNSIQQLMLPVVSRTHLGGDAFIGIALGAYSIGALTGGLVLGSVRLPRPGIMAFLGLSLYGLVPLALYSHSGTLIVISYFLGGAGIELFNIPWFTAIQNQIPKDMLGRVSSIDFLVSYGAAPLALAAMPTLLFAIGQEAALVLVGVIVLVLPVLALTVPGVLEFKEPR
ncbi:MFS transporter [Agrobacterium rhizogenes]|nr:MFS transporter [Rhizobium rhizogenes]NTJ81858.1 MFS transporter [Rhizobium rhizogenes]